MSMSNIRASDAAATEEKQSEVELIEKRFLRGPNVHASFPVVQMTIDLGNFVDTPSNIKFSDNLVELVPELYEHTCSKGHEGGFVERLQEGTYPAHIIEHVALAIQNTVGSNVYYGKSRRLDDSVYTVVFEYEFEPLASIAGSEAVFLVNELLKEEPDMDYLKEEMKYIMRDAERAYNREMLGPSTKAIIEAAKRRDIPFGRVHEDFSLFSLGWGKHRKMIWGPVTSDTTIIGSDLSKEKDICKEVLYNYGFPVPRGRLCHTLEQVIDEAEYLGYPVVLKPVDGHHGEGVLVNLRNQKEVKEAYKVTSEFSEDVLVEQYLNGDDFRFLIIGHKVVGVARRVPAHVIGDGKSNIKKLVEKENKNPKRGEGHSSLLTKLELGEEEVACLKRQGFDIHYRPSEGEIVYLRQVANISSGGTAENFTNIAHPTIKRKLERISKLFNLDVMGIDVIAENITLPEDQMRWGIIEVNTSPGLRMHLSPTDGNPIPVGDYIVENMFPEGDGRIPVVAVTGTNGKTTTARLIEWIARNQGFHTGLAVTGGIYSNGQKIEDGDTTGPWSAEVVLREPDVDFAVLETARGGIVKRGLGFDKCSVGVITNIREDHIGINGIESKEDLFWIKSLVVESTDPKGYSVINANDEFAERLMDRAEGRLALFSTERNELITEHIEKGGLAFLYENGSLWSYIDRYGVHLADANDIPYLMGGVEMLVENTLASVAAAYSSGISLMSIVESLKTFVMDEEMNPGRMNVVELGPVNVVLDYAHNRDALRALGEYTTHLNTQNRTLVFAGVGDRQDQALREFGQEAANWFDDIIITENLDQMRGRTLGEMPGLIKEGIESKGKDAEIILDRKEAVTKALNDAAIGDTVVIADLDMTTEDLEQFKPVVDKKYLVQNEVKSKKVETPTEIVTL